MYDPRDTLKDFNIATLNRRRSGFRNPPLVTRSAFTAFEYTSFFLSDRSSFNKPVNFSLKTTSRRTFPSPDIDTLRQQYLTSALAQEWHAKTLAIVKGKAQMRNFQNKTIPAGAVVFGAAHILPEYRDLVYEASRFLAKHGVPIATGGADGFMRLANTAAIDAGGLSIGIPLGRGGMLKNEMNVARDVHTMTIQSDGYESRIPLLLDQRPLVMVAPGNSGTLKELATTFFSLAASANEKRYIAFLGKKYYLEEFTLIHNFSFPDQVKNNIRLINDPDEMGALYKEIAEAMGENITLFSSMREATSDTRAKTNSKNEAKQEDCQNKFHTDM
jgi:uncharacterized protein (TIGR00725 family)